MSVKNVGSTDALLGFPQDAFDPTLLPDIDTEFISSEDIGEFAHSLDAPDSAPLVALNDWRPVHQRIRHRPRAKGRSRRTKDETREGYIYNILKWPFLIIVLGWITALGIFYSVTRLYIWAYERSVTWRGRRQKLRRILQSQTNYHDWKIAAEDLDTFLGNDQWKKVDEYAYYDHVTIARVKDQLWEARTLAIAADTPSASAITRLRSLVEACVKNNAFGLENPRLYSETYYGTKDLAQSFLDELHSCLSLLMRSPHLSQLEKQLMCKQLHTNLGRTVGKILPGGALVAALVSTRTDKELKRLLVPAYPHSPTILANYLTAPDCVIWSAVLASAAVPGILNPVVLMMKTQSGSLAPFSFGHKWKDGSLRTDIPLKALNLYFNVNFSVVSQVNPHINLFFFSSRGTVGRPVTHRKGRGWRGGYLGSAIETTIKLDLAKYLKILKHLELLPRPLGQDWSAIWLQQFSGTITIWPKSRLSDFYYILSDPTPGRLANMIQTGQQSTFPKMLFIQNRLRLERLVEEGLQLGKDSVRPRYEEPISLGNGLKKHELDMRDTAEPRPRSSSHSSILQELKRQSGVFFDDLGGEETDDSQEVAITAADETIKESQGRKDEE
ncbi:MAG: hypothetical protein Q9167_000862 [Letrouitia subvulpina]